jgi:hypothetical protein
LPGRGPSRFGASGGTDAVGDAFGSSKRTERPKRNQLE